MRPNRVLPALLLPLLCALPGARVAAATNPYLEAGVPAADREWHGADYARTADVLAAGKLPLPRLSDPAGRAVLERMTSAESLAFYRDDSIPVGSRVVDLGQLMRGVGKLLGLYGASGGKALHEEMARLMAFAVRMGGVGVELVEVLLPTLPHDDQYAARMEGLKKVRSGLTTLFVGAEVSLSERHIYTARDLSTLLEAMSTALPRLKAVFSDDFRVELRKKLEEHRQRFQDADDVRRIDAMIATLRPDSAATAGDDR